MFAALLQRLGEETLVLTAFTQDWLDIACNESSEDVISTFITPALISSLNSLEDQQQLKLLAMREKGAYSITTGAKIIVDNPMHIAMALIGYEIACNECGNYIISENSLELSASDDEDGEFEVCPHCLKSNGLMDLVEY